MENIKDFILNNVDEHFIYRGCACEDYELVPTLARKLKSDISFNTYIKYAAIVEKAAKKGYREIGMSGESNELSQHYGLITSYLDWSYSIYVALYFAFTSYLKQYVDENILNRCISVDKIKSLRYNFDNHKYCIYKLNKVLYEEVKNQYPNLPLIIDDTDYKNKRMKAQQGLLSKIDREAGDGTNIQNSQIQILADWLNSKNSDVLLKKVNNKYLWGNEKKIFLEKLTYTLTQKDRVYLQKKLKENNATSINLFPDFEGVKKNIEFSEDYNLLRDFEIAYHEPPIHDNFGTPVDGKDSLKKGEFFCF